jgi:hypothetical protein
VTRFAIAMTAFAASLAAIALGFAQTLTQPNRPAMQHIQQTDGGSPASFSHGRAFTQNTN